MKANRKFKDGEEAVSAVIGVILMVAITVAIAATVYVYVSGMMTTGSDVTPTITFTQTDTSSTNKLTVASADPSDLAWGDLEIQVDGGVEDWTSGGYADDLTVNAGQVIDMSLISGTGSGTNAYTVTLRHIPTNTLLGEWDFSG